MICNLFHKKVRKKITGVIEVLFVLTYGWIHLTYTVHLFPKHTISPHK